MNKFIFCTFGSDSHDFSRLITYLISVLDFHDFDYVVQAGSTKFLPTHPRINYFDFCNSYEYKNFISNSEFVVSHGGVGSFIDSFSAGKCSLHVPRMSALNEHINDHQLDTVASLNSFYFPYYRYANSISSFYSQFTDLMYCSGTTFSHVPSGFPFSFARQWLENHIENNQL